MDERRHEDISDKVKKHTKVTNFYAKGMFRVYYLF